MEELRYKEYTEEESRVYHQTMDEIMEGLKKGLTFREACGAAKGNDEQLRRFIEDDALKIMIADMHYNKGIPLEKVAEKLQVPVDKIKEASAEMLEDVGMTAVEIYRANNPDSPVGNA
jgi:hypothetical protein